MPADRRLRSSVAALDSGKGIRVLRRSPDARWQAYDERAAPEFKVTRDASDFSRSNASAFPVWLSPSKRAIIARAAVQRETIVT